MENGNSPELWEWAEYYCPWCYVAAVRLHKIMPEYQGRVKLRQRAFPLEIYGGGPPDRKELESEIWLAALQEPESAFKPFKKIGHPPPYLLLKAPGVLFSKMR